MLHGLSLGLTMPRGGAGAPAFSPASLSLTGLWLPDYGGSPWTGTASAGASGGRNLAEATLAPAIVSVNGHAVADWNTVSTQLSGDGLTLANLFGASGTYLVLCYADTLAADDGIGLVNPGLLVEGGSLSVMLTVSSAGLRANVNDGGNNFKEAAFSAGAWTLAKMRWNGTLLEVGTNRNAWESVACGSPASLNEVFYIGPNYGLTGTGFDGKIAAIFAANSKLSDAVIHDDIATYCEALLGVSL